MSHGVSRMRLTSHVQRVSRLLLKAPDLLAAHGGVASALEKVRSTVRERGWSGLYERLRRNIIIELRRADARVGYAEWVRRYDTLDEGSLGALRQRAINLSGPLISVLMPTYDTPKLWLREALQSVLDQIYPHWELCIADDA